MFMLIIPFVINFNPISIGRSDRVFSIFQCGVIPTSPHKIRSLTYSAFYAIIAVYITPVHGFSDGADINSITEKEYSMLKKLIITVLAFSLAVCGTACSSQDSSIETTAEISKETTEPAETTESVTETATETEISAGLEYWAENSAAAQSIIEYVESVTDENSENFVPVNERTAFFDLDGTLYGELFPTYFDQCLMLHRLLHDSTYTPTEEYREYAQQLEDALFAHEPEPDSDKSSAQVTAEIFKGFTPDEYKAYIRDFMSESAYGFEGMTYGEGFYKPMVSLVEYLSENDFTIFICSGTERTILRELTKDTLGEWIPPQNIIGSVFSLESEGQDGTDGRKYNCSQDEKLLFEGNLISKNQKMNKVFSIFNETGAEPTISFGNSSGDFSMGTYTLRNGRKSYMLLCDDIERDYGDIEKAEEFAEKCAELGFETISMKSDFLTIYGENVTKTETDSVDEEDKAA